MEREKRLIDANALKWKISQVRLYVASLRFGRTIISKILESYRKAVFYEIEDAPTVDAVEVVHGRWVEKVDMVESYLSGCTEVFYECSVCASGNIGESPYCPNCGARMMDGGNEDV